MQWESIHFIIYYLYNYCPLHISLICVNLVIFGKFSWPQCIKWVHIQLELVCSVINSQYNTCSYLFLLNFIDFVTTAIEMALTYSVDHGYGTDAYFHYTKNNICVQNDSGVHFYFCSLVEASSFLKVLSFIHIY